MANTARLRREKCYPAKDWKVKQCVITKLDSGSAAPANVPGMNVAPSAAVAGPRAMLKKQGTSKMHKFTPPVTLEQSIKWSDGRTHTGGKSHAAPDLLFKQSGLRRS
jgi:hypothetical protein